ncbi:MAG: DUF4062 domain-containing protein [Anaerolineales bacterium]|jgi:hypothetical protein
MSYNARVLKVMIASPGDVEKERRIARDVIHEWNNIHSEDKGIVLMPVGWETHSSPSMEAKAQEVINKQVLRDCDLLIAIFWTRIGTATGEFVSGTVEEIEEHIDAGKPAMIYFSSVPVVPESIDREQYFSLAEFKKNLEARGLIESYDSLSIFRNKLSRQLAQTIIRDFTGLTTDSSEIERLPSQASSLQISDDATELLVAAVRDGDGTIMALRTMGGQSVQTGERQFVEEGSRRSEARWKRAIDELVQLDLIRDISYKGEIFEVTADGYDVADELELET